MWVNLIGAIAGYLLIGGTEGVLIGVVAAWVIMWIVVIVGKATGLVTFEEPVTLWHRLMERPVSESGRLRHGDGTRGSAAAAGGC